MYPPCGFHNKNLKSLLTPKEPPTKELKRLIKRQNMQYIHFIKNGCQTVDKVLVDHFSNQCLRQQKAKNTYLETIGNKLNYPKNALKAYWNIVNKLVNKIQIPRIPPILFSNKFITNFAEEATLFNEYFSAECRPSVNNSKLPHLP